MQGKERESEVVAATPQRRSHATLTATSSTKSRIGFGAAVGRSALAHGKHDSSRHRSNEAGGRMDVPGRSIGLSIGLSSPDPYKKRKKSYTQEKACRDERHCFSPTFGPSFWATGDKPTTPNSAQRSACSLTSLPWGSPRGRGRRVEHRGWGIPHARSMAASLVRKCAARAHTPRSRAARALARP